MTNSDSAYGHWHFMVTRVTVCSGVLLNNQVGITNLLRCQNCSYILGPIDIKSTIWNSYMYKKLTLSYFQY